MPSVTVIRTGVTNPGAPVMTVHQENGPVVSLISTPPTVSGSGATWGISEHTRPGKPSLLIPSAPGLRGGSFDHWVRHRNPYHSVENEITALRAVAESGARVRFTGGGVILGDTWWWVESFDIDEEEKGDAGVTSRAKLSWKIRQATTVPKAKLTTTPGTPDRAATTPGSTGPATPAKPAPSLPGYGGNTRPGDNRTEF